MSEVWRAFYSSGSARATVARLNDPVNRSRLDDGMTDEHHAALDAAEPNAGLAFRANCHGFSA